MFRFGGEPEQIKKLNYTDEELSDVVLSLMASFKHAPGKY